MDRSPSPWALCSVALVAGWIGAFYGSSGSPSTGLVLGAVVVGLLLLAWWTSQRPTPSEGAERAAKERRVLPAVAEPLEVAPVAAAQMNAVRTDAVQTDAAQMDAAQMDAMPLEVVPVSVDPLAVERAARAQMPPMTRMPAVVHAADSVTVPAPVTDGFRALHTPTTGLVLTASAREAARRADRDIVQVAARPSLAARVADAQGGWSTGHGPAVAPAVASNAGPNAGPSVQRRTAPDTASEALPNARAGVASEALGHGVAERMEWYTGLDVDENSQLPELELERDAQPIDLVRPVTTERPRGRVASVTSASGSGGAQMGAADSVPGVDPAQEWALEETGEIEPLREVEYSRDDSWLHSADTAMDWEWNLATGRVTTADRWNSLITAAKPVGDDAGPSETLPEARSFREKGVDARGAKQGTAAKAGDEEHGPEEILGRLDSTSRELLLAELARSLNAPSEPRDVRLNVRTDTGEMRTVNVRLAAITDASGDFSRVRARLAEPAGAPPRMGTSAKRSSRTVPVTVRQTLPDDSRAGARADASGIDSGALVRATAVRVRPARAPRPPADSSDVREMFAPKMPAHGADLFGRALSIAGLAVCTLDEEGRVALATDSLKELVAEWPSVHAWWDEASPLMGQHAESREPQLLQMNSPNGDARTFEVTVAVEDDRGVVIARDATDEARAAASLRQSEARFAVAAEVAHGGLWDWDVRTDEVYYSPRWAAALGLDSNTLATSPDTWFGRVHPDDIEALRATLDAHVASADPEFEVESRVLHADGAYRWMLARGTVVSDANGPHRIAGSLADISERKQAEERLVHGTLYDALTGLPNRAMFRDMVARALRRFRRNSDAVFGVLVLDVDRLRLVNQSHGHDVGDRLLIAFAERLIEGLRGVDSVARLGGDEFAVLLSECSDETEAQIVSERIQSSLGRAFDMDGTSTAYVSASLGIVMANASYEVAETMIRDAETAMAQAKAEGKARHIVFDASMHTKSRSLLKLHTDLRKAVEREELELQYQPIIDLRTGRVSGFEALVRWRHHERGLIWPEEFIPVAEESGLIDEVSQWVLRRACRQLAEWGGGRPGSRRVSMSVNLSSSSFENTAIVDQVRDVLAETGIPPSSLRLEVTETVLMEHGMAAEVLSALKALGVHLYLDDFGTGYSSLAYLHQFNVDALKIDRSFVAKMHTDDEPSEIVLAITTLAHNLGLYVIAEGVQTPAQMERLRGIGCEYAQGYMFARPLDAAYAHALLVEDPVWS